MIKKIKKETKRFKKQHRASLNKQIDNKIESMINIATLGFNDTCILINVQRLKKMLIMAMEFGKKLN